ncbi:Sec-independent protein translocase subunit TatA [Methylomonas rapida]|jgi:twin arginine-targeting protein translocase, TatA/E family|uniref:Sec-independent protein translocase protein TatA n=1 Tax=Methylomonas rapida TaxID=2963939 RepID=A0ABY7GQA8_9GAMM|nr:Sec-independent protein translocase subunit TatA [Methylomonas rapida]WAR46694.1 Sec-independent protein translocase subunit TatA [Methylomonas rapida]
MGISLPHLMVVLAIVILLFGTKRLKNLGSDLGGAINGFRKAVKDAEQTEFSLDPRTEALDVASLDRKQSDC